MFHSPCMYSILQIWPCMIYCGLDPDHILDNFTWSALAASSGLLNRPRIDSASASEISTSLVLWTIDNSTLPFFVFCWNWDASTTAPNAQLSLWPWSPQVHNTVPQVCGFVNPLGIAHWYKKKRVQQSRPWGGSGIKIFLIRHCADLCLLQGERNWCTWLTTQQEMRA